MTAEMNSCRTRRDRLTACTPATPREKARSRRRPPSETGSAGAAVRLARRARRALRALARSSLHRRIHATGHFAVADRLAHERECCGRCRRPPSTSPGAAGPRSARRLSQAAGNFYRRRCAGPSARRAALRPRPGLDRRPRPARCPLPAQLQRGSGSRRRGCARTARRHAPSELSSRPSRRPSCRLCRAVRIPRPTGASGCPTCCALKAPRILERLQATPSAPAPRLPYEQFLKRSARPRCSKPPRPPTHPHRQLPRPQTLETSLRRPTRANARYPAPRPARLITRPPTSAYRPPAPQTHLPRIGDQTCQHAPHPVRTAQQFTASSAQHRNSLTQLRRLTATAASHHEIATCRSTPDRQPAVRAIARRYNALYHRHQQPRFKPAKSSHAMSPPPSSPLVHHATISPSSKATAPQRAAASSNPAPPPTSTLITAPSPATHSTHTLSLSLLLSISSFSSWVTTGGRGLGGLGVGK